MLLISSTLVDAPLIRTPVEPDPANGLKQSLQVMIDKPITVKRERVGQVIGQLDEPTMLAVTRALAVFLGIA